MNRFHRWLRVVTLTLLACFGSASSAEELPTIVVLGDSLSAAYGLRSDQGWVAALEDKLAQEFIEAQVINASISGATTTAGLQRLPSLLARHQPSWVILQLGANDGLQGKPVAHIRKNLNQLIELSQDSGAQVALLGVRLPPNLGARYTEPFFAMYAELAEEHHLPLVPFLLEGVAGDNTLMQGDGLHPQANAKDIIFNNVWLELKTPLTANGRDQ